MFLYIKILGGEHPLVRWLTLCPPSLVIELSSPIFTSERVAQVKAINEF